MTEGVTGPIGIARIAFLAAGRDWADLTVFIGMISVNLAVINFLPIAILDGGHMVFLIYEKLAAGPPRRPCTWPPTGLVFYCWCR